MSSNPQKSHALLSAVLTTFGYLQQMRLLPATDRILIRISVTFRLILSLFAMGLAHSAYAQTVTTYVNGTDGTINGSTTCAAPLVRNFVVGGPSFTVSDVDLGFFATHTWRGDIRLTLQSPDGTRVQLVNGDPNNTSGDNLNVLLNDSHAQTVNTDSPTGNHSTAAPPPFANNFSPNAGLSAFNGVASAGTWRLEICDVFTGSDDGIFRHAELYLTSAPTNYADLSLTKTVSNATPANGTAVSYTLTVSNAVSSPLAATGVQVSDVLPAGFTFISAAGTGTYNSGTGVWVVGSVPIGASRSITINGTVNATSGAVVTNNAEIIASGQPDLDSTVNNGVTSEDDYASASFTVSGTRVAGTPPTLVCPAGSTLFDWDTRTWAATSLDNTYAITGIGDTNFNITTDTPFVNSTPQLNSSNTGGISPAQNSLYLYMNNDLQSDESTIVITLPTAVPGAQFQVFDVDFNNNQFADKMVFSGTYNGASVTPVVTNGIANYVAGNTVIGDAGSGGTQPNGNATVTFTTPVDTITIRYGNHTTAPANPGNQAASLHDITFCNPQADLMVLKSSTLISDPVNGTTNPKALPGARVRYCILITNSGISSAENIDASDVLPADVTFEPGTIRSGATCAAAATVEDDNATGADEVDPAGANFNAGTITYTIPTILGGGASAAFTFEATIN